MQRKSLLLAGLGLFCYLGLSQANSPSQPTPKKAPKKTHKVAKAKTTTRPTPIKKVAPKVKKRPFLVIGHRGACGYLPEHTLASYKLAIKQGADYIEPDVVSTKDGVLIARHENEISGTTDVAKKFPKRKRTKVIDGFKVTGWFTEDFTWAEIQTLRAKERVSFRNQKNNGKYRIPSLAQILSFLDAHNREHTKKIGVYIETKHPSYFQKIGLALEPKLLKVLKTYGFHHKNAPVFIQSFEVSNLQWLHKRTKLPLIQLLYVPKFRPYDFVLKKDPRTYGSLMTPKGLKFIATYAKGIGPWKGLILPGGKRARSLCTNKLIQNAHKHGLLVHAYTFRNEKRFLNKFFNGDPVQEYHFFMRLGLDGLFSDFPDTAHKARLSYKP